MYKIIMFKYNLKINEVNRSSNHAKIPRLVLKKNRNFVNKKVTLLRLQVETNSKNIGEKNIEYSPFLQHTILQSNPTVFVL